MMATQYADAGLSQNAGKKSRVNLSNLKNPPIHFVLRDNLTLWTSDAAGDGEDGDAPEAS